MIKCTESRFRKVVATLREVGFSGLDAEEKRILNAFDEGRLSFGPGSERTFSEPSDREFEPRDHNDADGVQTMGDFA